MILESLMLPSLLISTVRPQNSFNTIIYQFCTETHNVKEYIYICSAFETASKDHSFFFFLKK